ncbi:MAG TPA: immunoglobulin domain-containing protein, partial [Verrucomicrobiae bacterium]
MKKIALLAACTVALSAHALPTYEPFSESEFVNAIAASGSNSVDLCTGGFTAPSGETWGLMNWSGTSGTGTKGLDILVTNDPNLFTYNAVTAILPANFPGVPIPGQSITNILMNPAQPAQTVNIIGNSAVLIFNQDITRPASGTKTFYISYLWSLAQKGQLGTGNDARYLAFVAQSNTVEGANTGVYTNWHSMLDTLPGTCNHASHSVIQDASTTFYNVATDNSTGKEFTSTPFSSSYNNVQFIVGAITLTANHTYTNTIWVNPDPSTFGGGTPSLTPIFNDAVTSSTLQVSDIGGMVVEDRPGSGASAGGIGSNFMANILIGTTWSYVTGGPEFTNQPVSVNTNYGSTVTLQGQATAAAQSVTYQWQRITATATNNIADGAGGTGGGATVTGSGTATLTLAGLTAADYGSYQLLATASGTGLSLASSTVTVTADPLISAQPQDATAAVGGTAVFNISASTQFGSVSYQWQLNGTALSNGTQADGSIVSGATGPTLTIANFQLDENGAIITCAVSNSLPDGEISLPATLSAADPAITAQPLPETVNYGATATFTASAESSHSPMTYAWYTGSTMLVNGLQADGSTVSGAQGSSSSGTLTATLTLSQVAYPEDGSYSLIVTNAEANTATSAGAALVVNDPYIFTQPPATVEVGQGGTANISVNAGGYGATYQWFSTSLGGLGDVGEFSGTTTSNLTITGAQGSDGGTYWVLISDGNGSVQSSNTIVYVDSPVTSVGITPVALTQQVGTHLALAGTVDGGTQGFLYFLWQFNGTTLTNGRQADGSFVSGVSASTLVLSNIQVADSGTYTLIATNDANGMAGSSAVTVTAGLLPLTPTNLEVIRIGDGSQTLSGATGNTLYLDQFTTNGGYVSTIMVPDSGNQTLLVPGAGSDGGNEAYLTRSSNLEYLNFAGYFYSYPYLGGSDVTVGQQSAGGNNASIRGIGAVNGLGYYVLAYTNFGLYSGGAHFIRSAYSTDGLTNFWTTGAAGGTAIKYVNAGPNGAAYAEGNGVPGFGNATNGPRVLGLVGTNLAFSDDGDNIQGVDAFHGAPVVVPGQPTGNYPTVNLVNLLNLGHPADFRFSPDSNTVYVADDGMSVSGGVNYGGGISRWDIIGDVYTYQYTLEDTTGTGTNGIRGLTVDFPSSITTWGQGVTGAVVYATTSETVTNRLIEFIDIGASSTPTLLETAGPNQVLRGVRFGPVTVPASIANPPQPVTSYAGQTATLTVGATGDAPFFYQWQFDGTNIAGATNSSLVLTDLQTSNAGTYTVIVSDPLATNSSSTTVSISSGPPVLLVPPQSSIETAGDHLAFSVEVTGTQPISYQWESNGVTISGATTSAYSLSNIVAADSATYSVVYTNLFGGGTNSATLVVTSGLQPLSSNNLVVARVGDGVEPLSSATGNTVYLDQFTPTGVYSNTIMIPDNSAAGNLIIPGGPIEASQGSVLNLSYNNSNFLNFAGFATQYPATNQFFGQNIPRAIGAVNAFGYYTRPLTPITLYNSATADVFDSAISLDGFSAFWTTGAAAAPPAVKYVTAATSGTSGGIGSVAGSAGGTRVVEIVGGSIVYSDNQASPAGIWGVSGEPTKGSVASALLTDASGSPNDFAASPDTGAYPPSTSTVYVADSSASTNGGGIQRYDWNGAAYVLSYSIAGSGVLTNGASCLAVDFSANTTWGAGVTGAIIYATTTGNPGNSLIQIVDTGAGSSVTVLDTVNTNEILRGVRFGPVEGPAVIASNPVSTNAFVGGTAVFSVLAGNGPLTYQWQLNGTNLSDGPSLSGSGAVIFGSQSNVLRVSDVGSLDDGGSYTVIVSNPETNSPV